MLWNSGQLPPGWTLKRLLGKHPSNPPNPLLANAFFRAGYIESWGRGIEKISRECRGHGLAPPVYDFEMAGLMLTFHANPAHLAAVPDQAATPVKSSVKSSVKILTLMRENPDITIPGIALRLNLTSRAVEKQINKLKAAGAIRRGAPVTPKGRLRGSSRISIVISSSGKSSGRPAARRLT